ncbi:MAG TPA: capsular biosynthesis protein [Candidatus Desulfovibrio intestinipullorum]|uniref:Capsular biosynthesis protein n=1 Tax=Candidatus Desulfovibrio intestinipullorum TaxID=2838536 RepID=A0A9D1PWB3_9BACT|nr:capsular biosynthesis protein [Candidatus Desulfovibrio intestinipullorum]
MRVHLFLQGPHGPFFRRLGLALLERQDRVIRVNCCGGDVADWPWPKTRVFTRDSVQWSRWIAGLMDTEGVTDLHVFGDWRPLHREAVLLARLRGLHVWAYDEGYLRPDYITMEAGGVNGLSSLPTTRDDMTALAATCQAAPVPYRVGRVQTAKTWRAIGHYAGTIFMWPFFRHFQTHRPQSASHEVWGWFLRVLTRSSRRKRSIRALRAAYRSRAPYFIFPLQLDSDSQVRRYSPYSGMKEAIACVVTSFSRHAPGEYHLLIRNHPLDNGLIDYAAFIDAFSQACGVHDRVHFVEGAKARKMMDKSTAVVVLNSTVGISALQQGKPVYCVGTAIYAMAGLAVCKNEMSLDEFWTRPRRPDRQTLADFERLLKAKALVNGSFYTKDGIEVAIQGVLARLDEAGDPVGRAPEALPEELPEEP